MIVVLCGVNMNEKIMRDFFQEVLEKLIETDMEPRLAFSVLMKLSAMAGCEAGMNHADFLRAADIVYKLETFSVADIKDLPMQ